MNTPNPFNTPLTWLSFPQRAVGLIGCGNIGSNYHMRFLGEMPDVQIVAAKAGKDVYCQKPLVLDFDLTKSLRNVFRQTGCVFQFGTQCRSMGRYRLMVQLARILTVRAATNDAFGKPGET
jgi:predicted dehydrogenase